MFDNFWNMFGDKLLIQIVHGLINKVFLNYIFVLISCRWNKDGWINSWSEVKPAMTNFIAIASLEQFILWSRLNHSVGGELISNNSRINTLTIRHELLSTITFYCRYYNWILYYRKKNSFLSTPFKSLEYISTFNFSKFLHPFCKKIDSNLINNLLQSFSLLLNYFFCFLRLQ